MMHHKCVTLNLFVSEITLNACELEINSKPSSNIKINIVYINIVFHSLFVEYVLFVASHPDVISSRYNVVLTAGKDN